MVLIETNYPFFLLLFNLPPPRSHTLVVRFRSRYRQPCDFSTTWGDGVKRGEKVKKKRKKRGRKEKGEERGKGTREETEEHGEYTVPPPFSFSARVFDQPR